MKQHIEPSHDNKHNQKKHSSPHCNLEFLIDVHFGESYDEKTKSTELADASPEISNNIDLSKELVLEHVKSVA